MNAKHSSRDELEISFRSRLASIESLDELQAWAADLYDSGLLDESEQYGDLAPWAVPDRARVIADTGEDVYIRLRSGELARWHNRDRAWEKVAEGDIPGRYRVHVIANVDDDGIAGLGKLVYAGDRYATVKDVAVDVAGEYFYGVAIVDTDEETIDWGDRMTDYAGNEASP